MSNDPVSLSTRRETFREETREQIKQLARAQLAASGDVGSLSLRSIARDLGVTAAALYSYFASKDDIITALIIDTFEELATRLAATSARRAAKQRLVDIALEYRRWALAEPSHFRLLFGSPLAGYSAPSGGGTVEAVTKFSDVLLTAVLAATAERQTAVKSKEEWRGFSPAFRSHAVGLGANAASAAFFVRYLGRVHGLVALELGGYITPIATDPEHFFLAEIRSIVEELTSDAG